jgi:hemoglobin
MPTLYDKYGGTPTMKILVREFYKQARVNPKVGHFFTQLNMEKLIDHQVQFLSFVLGKPVRVYEGRELADAHHPLNITDADFDEIGRLLVNTLQTGGVTIDDIKLIMGVVLEIRDEIVYRGKPSTSPPLKTSATAVSNPAATSTPKTVATKPAPTSTKDSVSTKNTTEKVTSSPIAAASTSTNQTTPTAAEPINITPPVTVPAAESTNAAPPPTDIKQQQKSIVKPIFGGIPKIKMIVRDLYSQVNDEPELRHYFLNVTPEKIIADQEHFASYVLRKADHAYLGGFFQSSDLSIQVGATIFNEVIDVLRKILINAGLPEHDTPRLITHIMEIIEETRTQCNDNKIGVLKSVDVTVEALSKVYQKGKLDTIIKGPDLVYASSPFKGGSYPFPFFTQIDAENQTLTLIAKAAVKDSVTPEEMGYLLNEAKQYAPILNFYADMDDTTPLYVASYSLPFEFGVPNRLLIKIAQQFSKTFSETFTYDAEEILLKVAL